jgi:hypothetical protein
MKYWKRFWEWLIDMKSADVAQIILIIIGFYFAGAQLKGLNAQLADARRTLQANTYMAFHQNLRELVAIAIEHPSLVGPEERRSSLTQKQMKIRERYTGLFLAHARNAFVQKQLGAMPDSVWEAMKADLKGMFAAPEVCRIWEERLKYQPADFRQFIENEILPQQGRCEQ